jgi:hypothetical protein
MMKVMMNVEVMIVGVMIERIKMPKRGVNWAFLKFIARIKS